MSHTLFSVPSARPEEFVPVAVDGVGPGGGAVAAVADVEALLAAQQQLLLALELCGYQPRAAVFEIPASPGGATPAATAVDLATWRLIDPATVAWDQAPRGSAQGTDNGVVGLWVEPRSDFGDGPGTGSGGTFAPPVATAELGLAASEAVVAFGPGGGGWLLLPLGSGAVASWPALVDARVLVPAMRLVEALAAGWAVRATDAGDVPAIGLLGLYAPALWGLEEAEADGGERAAAARVLRDLGQQVYERLLGERSADPQPQTRAQVLLLYEVIDSSPPSVQQRLADAATGWGVGQAAAEVQFLSAATRVLADPPRPPIAPGAAPAPLASIGELKRWSWTATLMRLQQGGAIDALAQLRGGAAPSDCLAEGRRILDETTADLRTSEQWTTLACFVPLQAPADTADDPAAAAAAQQLALAFSGFDEWLQMEVVDALIETLVALPPTSAPASMDDDEGTWLQTTGFDFEHHLMMLGACLVAAEADGTDDVAGAHAEAGLRAALQAADWDDATQGPRGKLAAALLWSLQCVQLQDAHRTGVEAVAGYWRTLDATDGAGLASEGYLTWETFAFACDLARGAKDLDGGAGGVGDELLALYWAVLDRELPELHRWSDERLAEVSEAFATEFVDRLQVADTDTERSRYYHLLLGLGRYFDPTYDFAFREHFDVDSAVVAQRSLEDSAAVRDIVEEARVTVFAAQGITDPDGLATPLCQLLRHEGFIAVVQAVDDPNAVLAPELARLGAIDDEAAELMQAWIYERSTHLNAFRTIDALIDEDQLAIALAELLPMFDTDLDDVEGGARQLASWMRKSGLSGSWLIVAATRQEGSRAAGLISWLGLTADARPALLRIRLIAALASGALLASDSYLDESEDVSAGLSARWLAVGLGAAMIGDVLDFIALGWTKGWTTGSGSTLAAFKLAVPARPATQWFVTFVGRTVVWAVTLPARYAAWVATRAIPHYTRVVVWEVAVAVRAALGVAALAVGGLAEAYAGWGSVQAGLEAMERDDPRAAASHYLHAAASVSIVLGSAAGALGAVVTAGWFTVGALAAIAPFLPMVAAGLLIVGIALHVIAALISPTVWAEGRLRHDLRAIDVLWDEIDVLSPVEGIVIEMREQGGTFVAGELLADFRGGGLDGGWDPQDFTLEELREFEYPEAVYATGRGTVIAHRVDAPARAQLDEPMLAVERVFLRALEAPSEDRIAWHASSGSEVEAGELLAMLDGVELRAPDAGTLTWYDAPVDLSMFTSGVRLGELAIRDDDDDG